MSEQGGVDAWAEAVLARVGELRKSQKWLGEQTAVEEGRPTPYGQGTIGGWLENGPPKPAQAFAMERALGVQPGSLTRLLGYLPVEAKPALTVEAALAADPTLTDDVRDLLLAAVRRSRKRRG